MHVKVERTSKTIANLRYSESSLVLVIKLVPIVRADDSYTVSNMTAPSPPLRAALIGLSSSPTGYGWLTHFHLPPIQRHSSANFEIVAVLGSSLTNAQKAIEKHNLPSTVRAYGTPEDLAQDEEVDFLVVGVKAPLHRDVLMPALQAGRLMGLFVEWPIGRSFAETEEIVTLAREQNLRTAVGLQGRYSAVTKRIHELVNSGQIGRILSTTAIGTIPTGDGKTEKASTKYALDPNNGATMLDIHFAHFIECVTFALDADVKTVSGMAKTMRSTTDIMDDASGEVLEKGCPKPSPDQVLVQGMLNSENLRTGGSEGTDDIVYSIHMRG